jgi:2-octaprenyl-6-methoxyphenol hydroxylase
MSTEAVEVAVIGAGPAGLAAALALATLDFDVALVAPPHDPARVATDHRTTALLGPSIDFLKTLGAWDGCAEKSASLAAVRLADDRDGLVHAPEMLFRAAELGFESFGANVPNAVLVGALNAAVERHARIRRVPTARIVAIDAHDDHVDLMCTEGAAKRAELLVAADGRRSLARAAAGIRARTWEYPQSAIVTQFKHSRPHEGIVNELHRRSGPLTTVPLPGAGSSLVWVEDSQEAQRIAGLGDSAFAALLEEKLHGVLGTIADPDLRTLYPLTGLSVDRMGFLRVALVGEAAHVVPPIGAQGLNLGLRDAAVLADCAADARSMGYALGGPEMLKAYNSTRRTDVLTRSASIDLLNRSLLADLLPIEVGRLLATHLIAGFAPLRRLLMEGGLGLLGPLPSLMRPNATPLGS